MVMRDRDQHRAQDSPYPHRNDRAVYSGRHVIDAPMLVLVCTRFVPARCCLFSKQQTVSSTGNVGELCARVALNVSLRSLDVALAVATISAVRDAHLVVTPRVASDG